MESPAKFRIKPRYCRYQKVNLVNSIYYSFIAIQSFVMIILTLFLEHVLGCLKMVAEYFQTNSDFDDFYDNLEDKINLRDNNWIKIYKDMTGNDLDAIRSRQNVNTQHPNGIFNDEIEEDIVTRLFHICKHCDNWFILHLCSAVMVFLGYKEYYSVRKFQNQLQREKQYISYHILVKRFPIQLDDSYKQIAGVLSEFFRGNEKLTIAVDERVNYNSDSWNINKEEYDRLKGRKKDDLDLLINLNKEEEDEVDSEYECIEREELRGLQVEVIELWNNSTPFNQQTNANKQSQITDEIQGPDDQIVNHQWP